MLLPLKALLALALISASNALITVGTKASASELPQKLELKGVPMVVQKQNYCVPASATMIAGFHKIKTDQDEVAELSSAMSAGNQGTYPSDMLHAMQKLGFEGQSLFWKNAQDFNSNALPKIRRALAETGPVYISFKPGVFGEMGHGCVIVGYNHRREELLFYNPWGNEFEKTYETVALEGNGVVLLQPPGEAPVANEEFITSIQTVLPKFEGDFIALARLLQKAGQAHELVWCSRRDSRNDKAFARDTARDDGRKILELAFERNPAVIIPHSKDGITEKYYFVTRPPKGGANFLVQEIDENGWNEAELKTLGSLTRNWVSSFKTGNTDEIIWELPMIELHPNNR